MVRSSPCARHRSQFTRADGVGRARLMIITGIITFVVSVLFWCAAFLVSLRPCIG